VDFRGGGESKLLRIVLTSRTASVEADVYDAGTPDVHARVIVFAEDERRWRVPSRFVATAFADNGGKATVQGLLPGKYLAAAVEHAEDGAWGDPDFLRRLRSGAATVTLTEASGPVVVKVKVMR
jgi:hypothetical protein